MLSKEGPLLVLIIGLSFAILIFIVEVIAFYYQVEVIKNINNTKKNLF